MQWVLIVIVFLWGLAAGSFLNVCIYRLPRGKSIVLPRSFCPHCRESIAWYDNIPILSYLILRGKCRHCGGMISIRYPLVELTTGILFVGVHLYLLDMRQVLFQEEISLSLITIPFFWYFVASLFALSLIDWEYFIIPDRITYPLIFAGLLFAAISPEHFYLFQWKGEIGLARLPALKYSFLGLAIGALTLWLIRIVGKTVFKKEAMGLGDVKLMAAVGAWQGWQMVLLAIFLGALVASVVGITLIVAGKARWGTRIPFGPYLAIGSVLAFFLGKKILFWYLIFYVS